MKVPVAVLDRVPARVAPSELSMRVRATVFEEPVTKFPWVSATRTTGDGTIVTSVSVVSGC